MIPTLYKVKAQFYYLYTKHRVPILVALSPAHTTFNLKMLGSKGQHGRCRALKRFTGWSRLLIDRLNWKGKQGLGHKGLGKWTDIN